MLRLVPPSVVFLIFAMSGSALAQSPPSPAPAASAGPPAPASPASSPQQPPQVAVALHADSPNVSLERRTSEERASAFPIPDAGLVSLERWEPACVAPCNARLDPRYAYRVSGEGLVPSRPFTLPQDKEHLVVDASMGSAYGRVGGLMLTAGGIGGLLLGGAALVASPILESQNLGSQTLRTSVLSAGVGLVGLGAIALGTGLWLWLSNDTKVNLEPSAAAKCPPHVRMTPTGFVF